MLKININTYIIIIFHFLKKSNQILFMKTFLCQYRKTIIYDYIPIQKNDRIKHHENNYSLGYDNYFLSSLLSQFRFEHCLFNKYVQRICIIYLLQQFYNGRNINCLFNYILPIVNVNNQTINIISILNYIIDICLKSTH